MSSTITLDVREFIPSERHAIIFKAFDGIEVGESIEIVNDHDPLGLKRSMSDKGLGVDWHYLASGPDVWRVRLTKNRDTSAGPSKNNSGCCGFCGS